MAHPAPEDPVAIVGFAFRFPQDATSEEEFWNIISKGASTKTEVPDSRYNIDGHYRQNGNRHDTLPFRDGHFLKGDISAFDAPFFTMNSAEARAMDPQLRLLLETSYHALEATGMGLESVRGSSTSVYVGHLVSDYVAMYGYDEEVEGRYQATGVSGAMMSNRLSWFYDLRGPSVTLDTACSSSLVGLHLGVQGLLRGEADMSLVCGSQLQLEPRTMSMPLARLGFLSPDGQCYSFDDQANGYSRGEGVGVVVLKRLSRAIRDGDTIRAVIRGTSANQDGRTPSISQPSPLAQAELIRKAYQEAGLGLAGTGYFEAHGTGTAVGDPIEMRGIMSGFSGHLVDENPLYIGSVKANIGHLEATAGIAGLIKSVLMLEKGVIPPVANLERLNPAIEADKWHLKFPTGAISWPGSGPRRASVNSFGFGGTNAHVVVDDAVHYLESFGLRGLHNTAPSALTNGTNGLHTNEVRTNGVHINGARTNGVHINGVHTNGVHADNHGGDAAAQPPFLFLLSASDENGIGRLAGALDQHIQKLSDDASYDHLRDLAFTLSQKRSRLPWKSFALGSTVPELRQSLSDLVEKPTRSSESPLVHFVFTGQGAQWASMGVALLGYPVFKESLELSDAYFRSLGSTWSLLDELVALESTNIHHPRLAQPVCTALQVALVDLLEYLSISPQAVVGHSSGEIAAAYCAGALDRESAWRVAYFRGEAAASLMADPQAKKGGMLAVGLSETELSPYISSIVGENCPESESLLSCGCINSSKSTTVTGLDEYIDALASHLKANAIFARKLNVPLGYHSVQMLPATHGYRKSLQGKLRPRTPRMDSKVPMFFSSVVGNKIGIEELVNAEYWITNLVSKVRFSEALEAMSSVAPEESHSRPLHCLIEVGPHGALERPVRDTLNKGVAFSYDYVLRRGVCASETIKKMAGRLVLRGHSVNLLSVNSQVGQKPPKMITDLPRYPFNHSQSYWLESRLSKNYRSRETPRHDFLGSPCRDWNPLKPKWRFTIRTSDLPWVLDHKIENMVLYPASGMLVMVFEAMRTLTAKGPKLAGYQLRDVSIPSALLVPLNDEGIEAQLHMHPHETSFSEKAVGTWSFWIYTVSGDDWKLHCFGQVSPEPLVASDTVSEEPGRKGNAELGELQEDCSLRVDSTQFYQDLEKQNVQFGEKFQTLQDIALNEGGAAMASVTAADWKRQVAEGSVSRHMIHPATLDSLFQMPFAALCKQWDDLPTMFPTQCSEVYVSCDLLGGTTGETMLLHSSITSKGISNVDSSVTAFDGTSEKPLVALRGCRLSGLHTGGHGGGGAPESPTLFHRMEWKPDINLLSGEEIEMHCRRYTHGIDGSGVDLETEVICRHFMTVALETLKTIPGKCSSKPHLQNYVKWAKTFLEREKEFTASLVKQWPGFEDDQIRPRLIEQYANSLELRSDVVSFGEKLVPILTGEVDPLGILFNGGLADDFYNGPLLSFTAHRLAAYMDLVAHKDSAIRIIEVGAGTGSTTSHVLEALSRHGRFQSSSSSSRFDTYDYTDISPSFFSKAQDKFAAHTGRMRFKTLDIERDPVEQGFEAGSYDIVIAVSVLHATTDIDNTLKNVQKLLKPGGELVFSEATNRRMSTIPFVFGLLPGWWLSSEEEPRGPLLTRQEWNDVVSRTGFSSLRVSLPDSDNELEGLSLMVASMPNTTSQSRDASAAIITETLEQQELAVALQTQLTSQSAGVCDVIPIDSLGSAKSNYGQCICLLEVGRPMLAHLSESQFAAMKQMLDVSRQILWVTDAGGEVPESPETCMISGFGKTIVRENPNLGFVHLNVPPGSSAATIARIVQYNRDLAPDLQETDFLEIDGVVHIPRAVEAPDVNGLLGSELHGCKPELVEVGEEGEESKIPPLELRFTPGQLDSFHFGPDESVSLPLGKGEVRVQVKATGINFKDVMVALNQVSDGHIGQEFAGVVSEIGPGSNGDLCPGDAVCGIANGTFRSYVRAKESHMMKIPPGMPFTEACALPVAYATVQYGLHHLARIAPGETILIHAAAGAVGQAAIQMAQRADAVIFVTVSTPAKKKLIMDRYGVPSSHFFSSRHVSFAKQIRQKTGGRGVDVVLNSLSGQALTETWRSLAPFGRFIEIGKRDISTFKSLPMDPFQHNVSFCSLDLAVVSRLNDRLMRQIMQEVQEVVLDGASHQRMAPHPLTVFKRSGFEDAFRFLQTGQHTGKAVIDWSTQDTIQIIPKSPLDYKFDGDATYVIAGGLGGIGRSVAGWMSQCGAKHLILLSRSGARTKAAQELVSKLEKDGIQVFAPECDISDSEAVRVMVDNARTNMPPIKGCIQGSMVVEPGLFRNSSLQSLKSVLDPKVKGTWNLHNNLPKGLDFFVLLSSLAGVHGASSQCNYAMGNAFLDAFARFRHGQGERCVTLDMEIVDGVGYIAERADIAQNLAMTYAGHKVLREIDLHFMLKWACDPHLNIPSHWDTQLLGALTTPAFVRRGGVVQDHGWMRFPPFRHLYQMERELETSTGSANTDSAASLLRAAEDLHQAAAIVTKLLASRLARSLAVPVEDIDTNKPPYAFGVDSLVAVELAFWFSNEIQAEVPVVQILGNSTIAQLGSISAEKSDHFT